MPCNITTTLIESHTKITNTNERTNERTNRRHEYIHEIHTVSVKEQEIKNERAIERKREEKKIAVCDTVQMKLNKNLKIN